MLDTVSAYQSLIYLLPEVLLTVGLLLVLVLDLPAGRSHRMVQWVAILLSLGALAATFAVPAQPAVLAGRMFIADAPALFLKRLAILTAVVVLWMTTFSPEISRRRMGEFAVLLLSATIGVCLMGQASDLLSLYLAVEMTSLGSYVLAGFLKHDRRGNEAALKYVIYGALASGLMIYGASLLYALTGQSGFSDIHSILGHLGAGSRPALVMAVALMFAGLGYKISAVPFHNWTPDVYEGAPTCVTAFLSVAPKAAGMVLFLRFFLTTLGSPAGGEWVASNLDWPLLVAIVSAATMTIGNLTALPQTSVKRMLAWSSVAHAGYLLLGAAPLTAAGGTAVLFYLVTYYLMNLGAFLVVLLVEERTGSNDHEAFRGLAYRSPFLAVAMTVFLLSLTGIPLTAGFIGKVYIFAAVIERKIYWLAIVGAVNAAISLFYYARVIRVMALEPPATTERFQSPFGGRLLAGTLAALTIVLGLYWTPLARWAEKGFRF